jgi:CBS domain-containing protein
MVIHKEVEMNSTVKQILDKKGTAVWYVSPETTINNALLVMAEKDIGAILIMENGKLVGIFSERDYARHAVNQKEILNSLPVSTFMTRTVITTTTDNSVDECMIAMTRHHIRHLPVVDGDKVIGIVTIGDVVKTMITDQSLLLEEMENYISGRYGR